MADTYEEGLVINITGFLAGLGKQVDRELEATVGIRDVAVFPDDSQIYSSKRTWIRIDDVVAVVVDLKGSTRLGLGRHAETTARVFEAATGGMVRVVEQFRPEFVDIQGDGLFALFHGHRRYERALCAAITLKAFGQQQLELGMISHLTGLPETGLKVGVAAGRLIVKEVGVRGANEPVWVGRAVNFAAKCAQSADKGEVVITPRVWAQFDHNEYVARECPCVHWLFRRWRRWGSTRVDTLPDKAADGRKLPTQDPGWCSKHGAEFCQAILDGKTKLDDPSGAAA